MEKPIIEIMEMSTCQLNFCLEVSLEGNVEDSPVNYDAMINLTY